MYPFFFSKIGPRGFLAGGFLTGGFLAGGFLAGGSILSRMAAQSHEKDLPEGGCANLTFLVCCSCLDWEATLRLRVAGKLLNVQKTYLTSSWVDADIGKGGGNNTGFHGF